MKFLPFHPQNLCDFDGKKNLKSFKEPAQIPQDTSSIDNIDLFNFEEESDTIYINPHPPDEILPPPEPLSPTNPERVKTWRDVEFTDSVDSNDSLLPYQSSPFPETDTIADMPRTSNEEPEHTATGNDSQYDLAQTSVVEISSDEHNQSENSFGEYSANASCFNNSITDNNFVLLSVNELDEPRTYNEAIKSKYKTEWIRAMDDELQSIEQNETWKLTDLPNNRKSIGCKWVFKIKRDDSGSIARFKARLVAQGFSQKYGIDYDEVFAPVGGSTTLRVLLSFAGKLKYVVKHYDVKAAFLNGTLEEEIFMRQTQGYKVSDKVYKLKKSLYGLKQSARLWNTTLHQLLSKIGFEQSDIDKCLYVLREHNKTCYLILHVDDLLFASDSEAFITSTASKISTKFELKDLGQASHYLGIDIKRDSTGNFSLSQTRYIEKIVSSAGLNDAKPSKYPVDTGYYKLADDNFLINNHDYRKLIGMLLYLTTHSRPDVAASVSILSQRVSKPRNADLNEVKRLIRYLKSTANLKLQLSNCTNKQVLYAFSDANWAECMTTRKSNSGYACFVNGGMVSWCCRKQNLITLSSTEAEYVALSETCKEITGLTTLSNSLPAKAILFLFLRIAKVASK